MVYKILRIDEDIDFGCEERAEGSPVMAIVTLEGEDGERFQTRQEDRKLYERNINEGDRVEISPDGEWKKKM